MTYSQCGQDIFVLSLLDRCKGGVFVDVGCQQPLEINNTFLLEERGWSGISLDIVDFSQEWSQRKTPFICADALTCDFNSLFARYKLPQTINYLSIDIEGNGSRFAALKKVFSSSDYAFEVITIEHDAYKGYDTTERTPQREFLKSKGYVLVCADVSTGNNIPFEDWWVNPEFIEPRKYEKYLSNGINYLEIFNKADVNIADYGP